MAVSCAICLEAPAPAVVCPRCKQALCVACLAEMRRRLTSPSPVDPCVYGAPRCPCEAQPSCAQRPCRHPEDRSRLQAWEVTAAAAHREWTSAEYLEALRFRRAPPMKMNCPVCRAPWDDGDD